MYFAIIFTELAIFSFSSVQSINQDCSLSMSTEDDALLMPVPYTSNVEHSSIIYPDEMKSLNIRYGHKFNLACTQTTFKSKLLQDSGSEVSVTCQGGNKLEYRGEVFKYTDFKCMKTPKSELVVTNDVCQKNYTVVKVGFNTRNAFLTLYKVCFDKSTKNSLYTWYGSRSPYFDNHQITKRRPPFYSTYALYGKTNVDTKYKIAEQKTTLKTILDSQELADMYIKNKDNFFLSRGHYAAKADFFFGFEQTATFYFANAAPQWQTFNQNEWVKLENNVRNTLSQHTNEKYVVVTGSYGVCTLPNKQGVQKPLYLELPTNIPVPLFFWKLVYNVKKDLSMVYVGLNNPYYETDNSVFTYLKAHNTCPDGIDNGKTGAKRRQIYCCTKESFEKVYGKLDPIIFQEI